MVQAIQQTNAPLPSLCEFSAKHIFWRANDIYFLTARLQRPTRPSQKISINNRQTDRNYAACFCCWYERKVVRWGAEGHPVCCVQYLYLFCLASDGSFCKYTLNSVIAILTETKRRRSLKESLPVIASLFTIMASCFHHDKLHTKRSFQSNSISVYGRKNMERNLIINSHHCVWLWQVSSDVVMTVKVHIIMTSYQIPLTADLSIQFIYSLDLLHKLFPSSPKTFFCLGLWKYVAFQSDFQTNSIWRMKSIKLI